MFLKNSLLLNDFKRNIKRIMKTDITPIILVSKANAELKEKANVFLKFGFLMKTTPKYILIIVNERKKISFEL